VIIPKRIWAVTLGLSILLLMPFSALIGALFSPSNAIWDHVRETLLPTYLFHTTLVLVISVTLATVIGASLGFLFARRAFPAKKWWRLALILPLAIPSYVYAMITADLFSITGLVGRTLAQLGVGVSLSWMNIPGVSVMFALALYPYVFLLTESTLRHHGTHYETAAAQLGVGPLKVFFKITLPLVLPGIMAGASLVAFEVLNDYGTVAYFNIPVFSFAIFDAWFRLGDLTTALRIGGYFIVFTFLLSWAMDRLKKPRGGRLETPKAPLDETQKAQACDGLDGPFLAFDHGDPHPSTHPLFNACALAQWPFYGAISHRLGQRLRGCDHSRVESCVDATFKTKTDARDSHGIARVCDSWEYHCRVAHGTHP